MSSTYKVKDVIEVLNQFAPPSLSEDFDNVGLLVGSPKQSITKCLITLDITEQVVDEAIHTGCNLIVSHHPIMFGGIKKINGNSDTERVVIKAIKNDIAIFAAHTNADRVLNGVSGRMAQKLELKNRTILSTGGASLVKLVVFAPVNHVDAVRTALFNSGAGHIGNYDSCSFNTAGTGTFRAGENTNPYVGEKGKTHHEEEVKIEVILPEYKKREVIAAMISAHPYEEPAYDIIPLQNEWQNVGYGTIGELEEAMDEEKFMHKLKDIFNVQYIRHTQFTGRKIKKVALCGGSGSFLLNKAIASKADIFITGDFKYHQFFDAEGRIIIADIGHYESEQYTKELFFEILTKKLSNFALYLSKTNTNPIKYF